MDERALLYLTYSRQDERASSHHAPGQDPNDRIYHAKHPEYKPLVKDGKLVPRSTAESELVSCDESLMAILHIASL
jgi:hypothetical protein